MKPMHRVIPSYWLWKKWGQGLNGLIGSFMYDLVATAPHQPNTGEILIGNSFGMFLGGKGANQAIAATRAGAKVNMVGSLGEDVFGDQLLAK